MYRYMSIQYYVYYRRADHRDELFLRFHYSMRLKFDYNNNMLPVSNGLLVKF